MRDQSRYEWRRSKVSQREGFKASQANAMLAKSRMQMQSKESMELQA
jgi:hypothetical protein